MSDTQNIAENQSADAYAADMAALAGGKVETPEVVAETKTDTAQTVAKVEDSATFDPSTLPPAAQALLEAERQRVAELDRKYREAEKDRRSLRGKIPHLQSDAAQWRKFQEDQKARAATPPQVQKDATPPASLLKALPGWSKHRTDYPEEAAPIEEAFTALEKQFAERDVAQAARLEKLEQLNNQLIERMEKEVAPRIQDFARLQERQAEQSEAQDREQISSKYAGWDQHVNVEYDKDSGKVLGLLVDETAQKWLDSMPAYAHKAAQQALQSSDFSEVNDALGHLYEWKAKQAEAQEHTQQTHQATQLQQQRQDNLSRRAVTQTNGSGIARMDTAKLDPAEQYALDMKRLAG